MVVSLAMTVVINAACRARRSRAARASRLALFALAPAVGWIVDAPQLRADCDTFTVQRADWRATDSARSRLRVLFRDARVSAARFSF